MTVRVLMADDHPMVLEGLRAMLRRHADIDVVATASDGAQALRLAEELHPDVVILDLRMPVMGGVEATRRIRHLPGAPHVLVLTTYDTDREILEAVEAGASGYLLKDVEPARLAEAIRQTARGRTVLAPEAADVLASSARGEERLDLSAQEITVLTLAAGGLTTAGIARTMAVSEATVKTYFQRAFHKLDAQDRTSAVARAISRGLIAPVD